MWCPVFDLAYHNKIGECLYSKTMLSQLRHFALLLKPIERVRHRPIHAHDVRNLVTLT